MYAVVITSEVEVLYVSPLHWQDQSRLANGVSMKAIQEWLGHSAFNVTANFYSHLDYHSKVESAETIAKVLGGDITDTDQAKTNEGSED